MLLPALDAVYVSLCILFEQSGVNQCVKISLEGQDVGGLRLKNLHLSLEGHRLCELVLDLDLLPGLGALLLLDLGLCPAPRGPSFHQVVGCPFHNYRKIYKISSAA